MYFNAISLYCLQLRDPYKFNCDYTSCFLMVYLSVLIELKFTTLHLTYIYVDVYLHWSLYIVCVDLRLLNPLTNILLNYIYILSYLITSAIVRYYLVSSSTGGGPLSPFISVLFLLFNNLCALV